MARSLLLLVLLLAVSLVCAQGSLRGQEEESELALEQGETFSLDLDKPKPRQKLHACWKDGESRGAGVMPDRETRQCPKDKPEKNMGLCYPKCASSKQGFGPLCWDSCPKMVYKSDGVVFCCETDEICSQLVTKLAVKIPQAIVKFAFDVSVNPTNVIKILRDFRELVGHALELTLPTCANVKEDGTFSEVLELGSRVYEDMEINVADM